MAINDLNEIDFNSKSRLYVLFHSLLLLKIKVEKELEL
jgi:hypothetical protein